MLELGVIWAKNASVHSLNRLAEILCPTTKALQYPRKRHNSCLASIGNGNGHGHILRRDNNFIVKKYFIFCKYVNSLIIRKLL